MTICLYTPSSVTRFEAGSLILPGSYAPFEVLPGHAPLISTLDAGVLRWSEMGEEKQLQIRSGVVRVVDDNIEICVEM